MDDGDGGVIFFDGNIWTSLGNSFKRGPMYPADPEEADTEKALNSAVANSTEFEDWQSLLYHLLAGCCLVKH